MKYDLQKFKRTSTLLADLGNNMAIVGGEKRRATSLKIIQEPDKDGNELFTLKASITMFSGDIVAVDYSFFGSIDKAVETVDVDFARYLFLQIINHIDDPYKKTT